MKKRFISVAVVLLVFFILFTACKKEETNYEKNPTENSTTSTTETTTESTTELTTESTTESTTKETTTKKVTTTTTKKETTTKGGFVIPVDNMHLVMGPPVQSTNGGRYVSNTGAGNLRENPNGDGYLLDVWATIKNEYHTNEIHDKDIKGVVLFSVEDFDGNKVTDGRVDVGTLKPGEAKKGTTTVRVDKYTSYQVFFSELTLG